MVIEINFDEIEKHQLIQREIKLFFLNENYLNLNKVAVKDRGWVYSEMEENEHQIN